MSKFVESIMKETNEAITENGALAYKTTNSALLDLFAVIGALRTRPSQEIIDKFTKAFVEDNLLAMKMLFYARNIRGGLGERRTFRILIKYLANYHTEVMRKNVALIPIFGRWDDLYEFVGTPLEDDTFWLISEQLSTDMIRLQRGKSISLLAKWLKSTSGVSIESAKLGKLTAKKLHLSYKEYRQMLSALRKQLNIVERNMSKDEWDKIVYREVPSLAMKKYRNAFKEHNLIEFKQYIEKVKKGEEKINSKTLYPYDIMEAAGLDESDWRSRLYSLTKWDEVLEEQWKALPNYVEGENNVLVMADTSASMEGRPICTSIGLSLYFAERNKGPWHNKFLTFSSKPSFIDLKGSNLKEKVRCIPDICQNTNIEAAFDLVLKTAIDNDLSQEDLPKAIIIISDMEFDNATGNYSWNYNKEAEIAKQNKLMDEIAYKFQQNGYVIPKIIYWNVDSRQDTYHAISENKNVAMVSGQSVSTFKNVLMAIDENPYEVMLKVLNDRIYDIVRV